jgi:hypothetical protein
MTKEYQDQEQTTSTDYELHEWKLKYNGAHVFGNVREQGKVVRLVNIAIRSNDRRFNSPKINSIFRTFSLSDIELNVGCYYFEIADCKRDKNENIFFIVTPLAVVACEDEYAFTVGTEILAAGDLLNLNNEYAVDAINSNDSIGNMEQLAKDLSCSNGVPCNGKLNAIRIYQAAYYCWLFKLITIDDICGSLSTMSAFDSFMYTLVYGDMDDIKDIYPAIAKRYMYLTDQGVDRNTMTEYFARQNDQYDKLGLGIETDIAARINAVLEYRKREKEMKKSNAKEARKINKYNKIHN